MTITERIAAFLGSKNLSKTQFGNKIGIAPGTISAAIKKNRSVNSDMLAAIAIHYPEINTRWLLTGEGEMLTNTPAKAEQEGDLETLKKLVETQDQLIKMQQDKIKMLELAQFPDQSEMEKETLQILKALSGPSGEELKIMLSKGQLDFIVRKLEE